MSDELHKGATGEIFNFARTLRKDQTEAEKILWGHLRNKRLGGYKFRRQHPIKNYIADFYCHEARLVIEVDGKIHTAHDQQVYDEGRTYNLREEGVKVIRFRNEEITNDIGFVLERIAHLIPALLTLSRALLTSSPALLLKEKGGSTDGDLVR